MPWFEWEGDAEEYPPAYLPERYDWLPFVSAVPPDTSINSSSAQPAGQGDTNTVMSVEMQWRRRSATGKRGDNYDFVHWMSITEILTFFKQRSYACESSNSEEPQCLVQSVGAMLSTQDYTPKPLSAYFFLVEVKNTKNPAKNCFIFYENLPELDDDMGLEFEIPARYEDLFPWGDDYEHLRENDVWIEIDTLFSVYVIDRRTGMQAKLYESKTSCTLFEYFDLSRFFEFEKCASLSQFSNGTEVDTVPVPCTHGFLPTAWKKDALSDPCSFYVQFEFMSYKAGVNPGTSQAVQILEFGRNDVLAFLEKGLVYK